MVHQEVSFSLVSSISLPRFPKFSAILWDNDLNFLSKSGSMLGLLGLSFFI